MSKRKRPQGTQVHDGKATIGKLVMALIFEFIFAMMISFIVFGILHTIIFVYPENLLSFMILAGILFVIMVIVTIISFSIGKSA